MCREKCKLKCAQHELVSELLGLEGTGEGETGAMGRVLGEVCSRQGFMRAFPRGKERSPSLTLVPFQPDWTHLHWPGVWGGGRDLSTSASRSQSQTLRGQPSGSPAGDEVQSGSGWPEWPPERVIAGWASRLWDGEMGTGEKAIREAQVAPGHGQ